MPLSASSAAQSRIDMADRPRAPVRLLVADADGRIYDHPDLLLAGERGAGPERIRSTELIALPRGSDLFALPGRAPIGLTKRGRPVVQGEWLGSEARAVAAFLAPAHTAGHYAVWQTRAGAPALPTFAYAPVGFAEGRYWTSAFRCDADVRQDPWRFAPKRIEAGVLRKRALLPRNRVARQLEKCALEYGCRAAQNFFLGRHEAPLPTSSACNAQCVGCISLQPDGRFRASHDRLGIPPTPKEIADVALSHFAERPNAVVSFGQGCEGEPLLFGKTLVEAVARIRARHGRGTVNLNSNASKPEVVRELLAAGLDAIRASMNSPRPDVYAAYYQPRGYDVGDVIESLRIAAAAGAHTAINLLCFPGVTDTEPELAALSELAERTGLHMIQLRNLNIDPELYRASLPAGTLMPGRGLRWLRDRLAKRFPRLRFGYFNPEIGPPPITRVAADSAPRRSRA